MEPFDFMSAWGDLWAEGGKALLSAQKTAARAMTGGIPDLTAGNIELAKTGQAAMEVWSSAMTSSARLLERLPIATGVDPVVEATLRRMMDPRAFLVGTGDMEEALGRMAEGPRLADLWDNERRTARLFRAWIALRRCSLEHQMVVLQGWMSAGRAFAERVKAMPEEQDAKALVPVWVETANAALLEMQRSEPFLKTQAALIKASTELRAAQQELVEYYGEQFGFPTRTELDDVHRAVTELRRELRALRRAARAVETPAAKKRRAR